MKVGIRNDIAELDKPLDSLLDRIVETNNGTVIAVYEKKITKLEDEKIIQLENSIKKQNPSTPWKI